MFGWLVRFYSLHDITHMSLIVHLDFLWMLEVPKETCMYKQI